MPVYAPAAAGGIAAIGRQFARRRTVAGGIVDGGSTQITETFESGGFSAIWGSPVVFGTGTRTVTAGAARTGSFGAHFDKPYNDSANYIRAAFTATNSLKCGADYRWATDSGLNSNGTGPRVFAGANRIFDVFRQDITGAVALRYQSTGLTSADALYIQTGVTVALNTWVRLEVQMDYAAGANSRARVWVDGVLKIDQAGLTVHAGAYDAFQLGAEHTAQFLNMDVDNVAIDAVPVDDGDPGGGGANNLISSNRRLVLSSDGTTVFSGRGVNVQCHNFSFQPTSFDSMATEGINFARLGTQWKVIEGAGPGVFDQNAINFTHTSVQRAAAEGINVFICLLLNSPTWADAPARIPDWARGTNGPASPVGEWNTASQFDCLASSGEAYVRRMVGEFCEYPNVVGFDFCNEPDRSSAAPIQRGTERMLAWARDADTTDSKLWFVATNCYSSQSASTAFNDWDAITDWTRVVLQVHTYYAPAATVDGWRSDNGIRDSANGRYWNGGPEATSYSFAGTAGLEAHFASWEAISVAKNVPWILGEYGVKHAQADATQRLNWAQHVRTAAQNKGCAGMCWWIYADTYAQDAWSTTNTGYVWRAEAEDVTNFTASGGGGGTTPPTIRAVGALGETPDTATAAMTVTGMTLPAGTTTNDLMLMFCYFDSGAATSGLSITAPSGWTQVVDLPHAVNANMLRVYAKVAGGAEGAPASPTFNGGTTGASGATGLARVISVVGADVSGGAAAALAGVSGGNGVAGLQNMGLITGFTPTASNSRVFVFAGKKATFTSVATLTGDGLTWSEDIESPSTRSDDAGMVVNSAPQPGAATAISDKTFTVTGGSTANFLGIMFAIRPA